MISVIKETYAVRLLPLYFRTGCDPEGVWVPFCGCLETLAAQVSSLFHGSKGEGASQRAVEFVEREEKGPSMFKTSVSPGDNGWTVYYKWCIFFLFLSSCWWHMEQEVHLHCLPKYCDISSTGKTSITTSYSNWHQI